MRFETCKRYGLGLLLALLGSNASAAPAQLAQLSERWAQIQYQLPKAQREAALLKLSQQAALLRQSTPSDAGAMIWEGIVLSSLAAEKGGVNALSLLRQARADFEAALQRDPTALNGAAYTSLGALYYQVPGWPLSFASDDKAEQLLRDALQIAPQDIDANYYYGDFLRHRKQWQQARLYLQKALAAPPRAGRELADEGRRHETEHKLQEVMTHLAK